MIHKYHSIFRSFINQHAAFTYHQFNKNKACGIKWKCTYFYSSRYAE